MKKLTKEEKDFLMEVLSNVIKNGNSVNQEAFTPTGKQYKIACEMLKSIDEEC